MLLAALARLTEQERETLFGLIKLLRRSGIGVVYIARGLDELFAIAQRVTVLRGGKHIATHNIYVVTQDELDRMMSGREPST